MSGQMSTTGMRPIRETIPLEEARALIDETVPPFSRAAMDGYAVRAEDTFDAGRYQPVVLRVLETVYTGQLPTKVVQAGECVEIATGAPLPTGADAIVQVEETERRDSGEV